MKNILLGLTGSVAAIKHDELVTALADFSSVKVVYTNSARYFIEKRDPKICQFDTGNKIWLPEIKMHIPFYVDENEWRWRKKGDPILHIELRKWADVMVIAPLSANSLGKIVNGLCDNLLTSVVRAWDFQKPLVVAPAMNSYMWESPITSKQLDELRFLGIYMIPPVSKVLACGDEGFGAMASVETIAETVKELLV